MGSFQAKPFTLFDLNIERKRQLKYFFCFLFVSSSMVFLFKRFLPRNSHERRYFIDMLRGANNTDHVSLDQKMKLLKKRIYKMYEDNPSIVVTESQDFVVKHADIAFICQMRVQ